METLHIITDKFYRAYINIKYFFWQFNLAPLQKNGANAEQAPIFENANKMNKIYHIWVFKSRKVY